MGDRDTIFALSTPPGRSAIAVVRISGAAAGPAATALAGPLPQPRRASLRRLREPDGGAILDQALLLWFPGPATATGEDLVELHLHGGPAVVRGVLAALGAHAGLRPAEPGEFTRRAFDNDRLDLTEVEGLSDLLSATSQTQRRLALRQMDGALSAVVEGWQARLVRLLAHVEAAIDFADEELPPDLLATAVRDAQALGAEMTARLGEARPAERLREGFRVALLGAPNAGKSSLLNRLAGREAAIVAATPGTTRDVVEVGTEIGGLPVTLADTAGLREAAAEGALDPVEAEGIRRSLRQFEEADLILLLFDGAAWPGRDQATEALLDGRAIPVVTKADLPSVPAEPHIGSLPCLRVSTLHPDGLAALESELGRRLLALAPPEDAVLTRERHRHALAEAVVALARLSPDEEVGLVAEDLRLALRALGRILGRVDVEQLLDVIFRDFCLGK